MTEIEQLWKEVRGLEYPTSVVNKQEELRGPAFFPGGAGMFVRNGLVSDKPIMILGQDQDNEKGFRLTLENHAGDETYSLTWQRLTTMLTKADINLNDCFFTNFIMGIRSSNSNSGPSPALEHPGFIEACAKLMITQISMQRPKAILCLGKVPLQLLGSINRDVLVRYIGVQSFKEIHERGASLNIDFPEIPGYSTTLVALNHPSSKRRKGENKMDEKEHRLLLELPADLRRARQSAAP